ncbi:hypothetical protein GCM10023148_36220 [Actinokineospora soli]
MPPDWTDDARLLVDLRAALDGAAEVPEGFAAIGKSAFAWRDPDARIAELVEQERAALRDDAAVRAMTFAADGLGIELEITADALLGQLVPPGPGRVELHEPGGRVTAVDADDVGWFTVRHRPAGLFRLAVHADGGVVVTAWTRV